MRHIITGLAIHFSIFEPSYSTFELLPIRELTFDLLCHVEIITAQMQLQDSSTRRYYQLQYGNRADEHLGSDKESDDEDNKEEEKASPDFKKVG